MNLSYMFTTARLIATAWLSVIGIAVGCALAACDTESAANEYSEKPSADAESESLSVQMLRAAILSGSTERVVDALNIAKQAQYRSELVTYVAALWTKQGLDSEVHGKKVLDDELVRVNIADVLLQASANDHIEIDTREILSYLRPLVRSPDKQVAMAAASALGSSTESQDVDVLAAAATDLRDSVFRAAVLALAFMCDPRATDVLTQLADSSEGSKRGEFLKETVERAAVHRETTRACRGSKH